MKISYEDDYALKAVLDLALLEGQISHIKDIAKRQDIPIKFLEQLLLKLKKSGIVESKKGPNGGYRLLKKPEEITVKEILEILNGPFAPIECAWNKQYNSKCNFFNSCVFRLIFKDIYISVNKKLSRLNFKYLAEKQKELEKSYEG